MPRTIFSAALGLSLALACGCGSKSESTLPNVKLEGDGENGAILRLQGMPAPGGDRVYQAWVQRDGTVVPQPTFEVGESGGGAVAIPDDLSDAQSILVTREPRGGARAPGEVPILAVGLQ